MRSVAAGVLRVAFLEAGPPDGPPVVLLHGFPYDVHAFEAVSERLAAAGRRCIVPYLRGYGPTAFLAPDTPRSGQQAALGADLLALLDALAIPRAVLAGFDWGGRAAAIVAALWPERVKGLVSCGTGYNIQDIARSVRPAAPEEEHRYWYQYYFHTERGRAGLARNRHALCRLLWRLWSPTWGFDEDTFARTAAAFNNPDFVEVVIHSYRHRFGYAAGDPGLEAIESRLAAQPAITVPAVVLQGGDDGVEGPPQATDGDAAHFTGPTSVGSFPASGTTFRRRPRTPSPKPSSRSRFSGSAREFDRLSKPESRPSSRAKAKRSSAGAAATATAVPGPTGWIASERSSSQSRPRRRGT